MGFEPGEGLVPELGATLVPIVPQVQRDEVAREREAGKNRVAPEVGLAVEGLERPLERGDGVVGPARLREQDGVVVRQAMPLGMPAESLRILIVELGEVTDGAPRLAGIAGGDRGHLEADDCECGVWL